MTRLRRPLLALAIGLVLIVGGCATIISGRTSDVQLVSSPPEARVVVQDAEGKVVAQAITPASVSLKRSRKWFRPARYTATFEKYGYETAQATIDPTFNPWAIGNLAVGGGLGVVVDVATGALYRFKTDNVQQALAATNMGQPPMLISGSQPTPPAPQTAVRTASAANEVRR
ncbi:hypothetical protein [Botrimarina hoheduenensis]|uniref:PEGA domain protein n=1 Tax=Botrimarina hoheduenensis TaxID=2528000 RepID=A0A5C5W6P3_9BACT|nr:hypothetical protein [Botrimarina hoheduenensis]TWT46556.1 hypothetical protein Pla111_16520 [Botrimarina hoheduenensis]